MARLKSRAGRADAMLMAIFPVARAARRQIGRSSAVVIIKIAVTVTLLVVTLLDAASIATTQMSLGDQAFTSARAGADSYRQSRNATTALLAAQGAAQVEDSTNVFDRKAFAVLQGGQVHVRLDRIASTILAKHLPIVRTWVTRSADSTAAPMP